VTVPLLLSFQHTLAGVPGAPLTIAPGQVLSLGSGATNELRVRHGAVGAIHARFDFTGPRCTVRRHPQATLDAMSIVLAGRLVRDEPVPIEDGAELHVGGLDLRAEYRA
jgi:hypothetical protein